MDKTQKLVDGKCFLEADLEYPKYMSTRKQIYNCET